MADRGTDLLRDWQRVVESVVGSAASRAGRADLPRQLLELLQKQAELVQEIADRERRLQRDIAQRVAAPFDTVFDLLAESGAMLSRQAEALEASGRALEETAGLMRRQAELFEATVDQIRQPVELAKSAAGLERRPRRGGTRRG